MKQQIDKKKKRAILLKQEETVAELPLTINTNDCLWITYTKTDLLKIIVRVFLLAIAFMIPAKVSAETPSLGRANDSQVTDIGNVVPVHQLSDISTTDWQFQALTSLSDRTCLSDDRPDNRALTRYEFAAALQVCLDRLSQQYTESPLTAADRQTITRLQREFATELATLEERIDNLENRTAKLEEQTFSTTTKLNSEVLFQIGDSFSADDSTQTFLGYRARLNFDTSFYGSDRLRVRLGARNIGELEDVEDTFMVRLGTGGESDNEIETEVSYELAIGDRLQVVVGVDSVGADDVAEVLNPLSSSGRGAVSRFARRNPSTLRGPSGSGGGIQYEFSDAIQVSIGYFADSDDAADSASGLGLFGSSYSAVAQLLIEPIDDLEFAFTYTRTYFREGEARLMGATGSENANEPFGETATSANNFGFQVNWELSDRFEIGGWFGYTAATQEVGGLSATILNGAITFAFPDLGGEGNEAGIIIGVPPIVTQHDDSEVEDERTSLHIEALYRISVDEQLSIIPGVFLITQPEHSDREPIWVGSVRSLWRF